VVDGDEVRWMVRIGGDVMYDFFGYVFEASDHLLLVQFGCLSLGICFAVGAIAFMGDGGLEMKP